MPNREEILNQFKQGLTNDALGSNQPETNCNQAVTVDNFYPSYNGRTLGLFPSVTPNDIVTSISFVRVVMTLPPDNQKCGSLLWLYQGDSPANEKGVTVMLNLAVPFVAPGPGTSILCRVDGTLQTPLGPCQFWFEQAFPIN